MVQNEVLEILSKPEFCHYFDEISQVHMYTKHYLLMAEELSEDGVTFLQPLKEHRDAYDHLTRIYALPLKDTKGVEKEKYIMDNLKKAFGHEYRAFFDTADWLTYICRKYIRTELSYNAKKNKYKCEYTDYEEIKEFINEVPFMIAKYREEKDISNNRSILDEVIDYKETMDKLLELYKKVKTL